MRAGWLPLEEEHIRLNTLSIKDTRRQPQQRMHIALLEQLAPHNLTSAALKEHIIRYHHRCPPMHLQQCPDVLNEVELLVAGRRPEVLAHHHLGLALLA